MTPIKFTEQNLMIVENQDEYITLPAYKFMDDEEGRIAFCWKMTWSERFKALISGIIWHQVLTFNGPLQPQLLSLEKPYMESKG